MAMSKELSSSKRAEEYLRQPYMRVLIPQADGTFHAEILELPGCFATGDTPSEAFSRLEDVASSWIEAALESNQTIPHPVERSDYSGKIIVRMPRSLHRRAAWAAQRDDVSLNQFIVSCIAEGVGARRSAVTASNVSVTLNSLAIHQTVNQIAPIAAPQIAEWSIAQHG